MKGNRKAHRSICRDEAISHVIEARDGRANHETCRGLLMGKGPARVRTYSTRSRKGSQTSYDRQAAVDMSTYVRRLTTQSLWKCDLFKKHDVFASHGCTLS